MLIKILIQRISYLVVIFCCSCTASSSGMVESAETLWESPIPEPDFIHVSRTTTLGERYCGISLRDFFIRENGDMAYDLLSNLEKTTELTIDGNINIDNMVFLNGNEVAIIENEEMTGSFFGEIVLCFDTSNLDVGLHVAHIKVYTTSSTLFEYRWAFELTT